MPFPRQIYSTVLVLGTVVVGAAEPAPVDFRRDVLPILSDKCFQCHGPDEKAREAKLRFDDKASALRTKEPVILPGQSATSPLMKRILSHDPDEQMPPPKANRKLTAAQIATLQRWIDEGAVWGRHWAFTPITRPEVPRVRNPKWLRSELDNFILAPLEQAKLSPAAEADKSTWLRRVTLDLTGLPPTPTEVAAFLADPVDNSYEKVVNQLLKSPRYGERMASEWLDLARYADTHGFQMDRYRAVWPYRDWVIQSFHQNQPFDQFILWQLAGDLLPNPTKEQRLATAFNRLHLQNEEGGIVEEQYRVTYVVDRVNTFGTAFLGLTLECTRCHDHKFDPLTMQDFYSLFAFFQNIDESGQTTYFTDATPVPTLLLSTDIQDAKLSFLQQRIKELERDRATMQPAVRTAFDHWLNDRKELPSLAGCVGQFNFDELAGDKLLNAADEKKNGRLHDAPKIISGLRGNARAFDGENGLLFPGLGHFKRTDPFTLSLWLQTPEHAERNVVIHHSKAPIDAGSRGYELLLEKGRVAFGLHHMWPGNSLKVVAKAAIPLNQWTHITATYDGSSSAAGVKIYLNGQFVETNVIRDSLTKDIRYSGGEPDLAIGYRFRDNGFKGGRVDEFLVFDRAVTSLEAAHLAGRTDLNAAWKSPHARLTQQQLAGLFDYYVAQVDPTSLENAKRMRAVRDEQNQYISAIPEVMVMRELPQRKPAYILKRGAYDAHGDTVESNTPGCLPPFPNDLPRNRLGLGRWLLDPAHPLTARVTVNRAWQMLFGRGLTESSDNFGAQGQPPTHPELLDWLATEFIESGWNYQHLLKTIVLSSTYRQASRPTPEQVANDPDNRLWSRAPVRRLTAEMLRDQAVFTAGLLVEKQGGPSVKPYQPAGLWEEIAMGKPTYDQGHGDDLHRRSLYTFWKRTVPHPAMVTFDAADRSYCTVRRQSTSTPLQALALLNDTQIVESARLISQRMFREGGETLDEQVAWVFRLVTSRSPTDQERTVLKNLYQEQRKLFEIDRPAAAKLLRVGETKNAADAPVVETAAGTVLALAILNHDSAVMRR